MLPTARRVTPRVFGESLFALGPCRTRTNRRQMQAELVGERVGVERVCRSAKDPQQLRARLVRQRAVHLYAGLRGVRRTLSSGSGAPEVSADAAPVACRLVEGLALRALDRDELGGLEHIRSLDENVSVVGRCDLPDLAPSVGDDQRGVLR